MPNRPIRILPSILAADFACLGEQVREAEAGGAHGFHVDVMDGHFVPNISMGPLVVEAMRRITALPLHVHLMISQPERYIAAFARAGADLLTVHVETCPDLSRTLALIAEAGAAPAVTLKPATPLDAIADALDLVELVLVLTVEPGFGGQSLIYPALAKVATLRRMLDARGAHGRGVSIEVDGGVNLGTLGAVLATGADSLVVGTAIFGGGQGPRQAMLRFRAEAQKHGSAVATPG